MKNSDFMSLKIIICTIPPNTKNHKNPKILQFTRKKKKQQDRTKKIIYIIQSMIN